jgi:hypothetical protein
MILGIVYRRNEFFRQSTWVEVTEDGVQEVQIRNLPNGRAEYVRTKGFIFPYEKLRDSIRFLNKPMEKEFILRS